MNRTPKFGDTHAPVDDRSPMDGLENFVRRKFSGRARSHILNSVFGFKSLFEIPERRCVVLDQPQMVPNFQCIQPVAVLRLVFDTAALHFSNRH